MYVSDWMKKKVITVSPDDSISEAARLATDNGIKHLPVLRNGKIAGILSDRDIKEYVPSRATSLDVYELHYLLSKTRVKEVMKKKVFTIGPDTPIEEAALIMYDNDIGCLPVVERGRLVGIISDRDIFRVLIDITGVRHGGHRVYVTVQDKPGSIRDVADIVRKHGFALQSILTSYEDVRKGYRHLVVRTKGRGGFQRMQVELEENFKDIKIKKG